MPGGVMQVSSIFIGAVSDMDICTSRRMETLIRQLPGVYQTHHKIVNGCCHGLMIKYDPTSLMISGLNRELIRFDSNRQWHLCDPQPDCHKDCPYLRPGH